MKYLAYHYSFQTRRSGLTYTGRTVADMSSK